MALSKIPSAGFQDNVKFRNLVINGDMSIAQRSTSTASITTSGYHTVDRFYTLASIGTWTQSQSTHLWMPINRPSNSAWKTWSTLLDTLCISNTFVIQQPLRPWLPTLSSHKWTWYWHKDDAYNVQPQTIILQETTNSNVQ